MAGAARERAMASHAPPHAALRAMCTPGASATRVPRAPSAPASEPAAAANAARVPSATACTAPPRRTSWSTRSRRFRAATAVYGTPSRCRRAIVDGAKSAGAARWKSASRMSGTTKHSAPATPGRSSWRERRTRVRASGARAREKATSAAPSGAPAASALSSVSCSTCTSSNAELAPSPKYGLSVCAQSPTRTAHAPWCSVGATVRNTGRRCASRRAARATASSSTHAENCGTASSSSARSSAGAVPAAASGSPALRMSTPLYRPPLARGSASMYTRPSAVRAA
mmetsp:Transcript_8891/g.23040  ORF Transcript_8891/g.23040 Transcript_8891/m.23040 type:complete len:284 (-) Transcript_8891:871-1722(-)